MTSRYNHNTEAGILLDGGNSSEDATHRSQMSFWEEAAATVWGSYITEVERRMVLKGQGVAGEPREAIEIGCGSGRWSKLLADLGWRMTCVDADPVALEACQRKIPDAKCMLVGLNDNTIPCPSNSASLLLCIEVAEVMESDWFLPEVQRVLTENGIFVALCWNIRSWRGLAMRLRYYLTRSPDARYFYKRSYSTWQRKLAALGLRVIADEGLCWGPFGRTSNSELIPAFVRFERVLGLNRLTSLSPWVIFVARKVSRQGA